MKPAFPRLAVAVTGLLLATGSSALTVQLSESIRPQLLLHTDAHVARIRQVAADAEGRFLLTVSEDKTARIWELSSGEARRTWVAPVGIGEEGKLFAAALSPDGRTAAVGGWTSDGAKGFSVHLFDRTSGALVRRLGGFRNLIVQLAWSPDGRLLAVATGGGGIYLVNPADGKVVGEDRDYSDTANGMDFSRAGQLAVVADDGAIRLYSASDKGLALATKKTSAAGKRPTGVRFSPDGGELAVAYEDSGAVEIFSAQRLESRHLASDARTPGLTRVAWSSDGQRLMAAGRVAERGRALLRSWGDKGRGAMRSLETPAANSVLDLVALKDGRLVLASADPLWAVMDAGGKWQVVSKSDAVDFRGLLAAGIQVSQNGQRIFIPNAQPKGGYVSFGFDDRTLSTDRPPAGMRLASGLGAATVKRERSGDFIQAGEARYTLERYEQPRVLIMSPSAAVVGSEWFLRMFDARGQLQWKTPLPATAWALGVVDGGRMIVAALGDGTIRWFNRQSGQEMVAFFLKSGTQRWVAWTPAGYYDSSPGGEDLLGWALPGGETADFFPISRFRTDYFQPERVRPAAGAAPTQTVQEGPKKIPPVVEILSPADGSAASSDVAALTLRVRPGSGGKAEKVKVRLNGRFAKAVPLTGDSDQIKIDVPLDPGENQIELFAESRDGTSKPASLKLAAAAPPPAPAAQTARAQAPTQESFNVLPKLYVLSVGVSEYRDKSLTLGFAAKDARDFVSTISRQKGRLYRDVEVRLLADAKATRDAVLDGLEWLRSQVTARDVGMLFIAGHGVNDSDGGYYYLPVDTDLNALKRTGVIFSEIRNTMANLSGKALFFIDTCHSGNVLGGRRGVPTDITGVINELASAENGVVVFSSSTGRQFSLENAEWGNGAFTKALVEGLEGQADFNKSGKITHKMLDFFLAERVKELTGGKQTPVTQAPGGVPDFPIALR